MAPQAQMELELPVGAPARDVERWREAPVASRSGVRRARPLEGHAFRERWWVGCVQFAADAAAVQSALLLGIGAAWALGARAPGAVEPTHYLILAGVLFLVPLGMMAVGLYPGYGLGPVERLRRRLCTIGLVLGVLIAGHVVLLGFWFPEFGPLRGVVLVALTGALVLCPLAEALARRVMAQGGAWGTPVAVLGGGGAGGLVKTLRRAPQLGLIPTCVFDDDPSLHGRLVHGVPVVGPLAMAKRYANRLSIALLLKPRIDGDRLARLAARLPFQRVIVVPNLAGLATAGIVAHDLGGVVGLEVRKNLLRKRALVLKRAMDYLLGAPLFVLSLPLLAVLAAWIKCVSPGPATYTQQRIGLRGRKIKIWKLRTMHHDAEQRLQAHLDANPAARQEWERYFKLRNDPRVLPGVGRLLRCTSLDELPQLWNVLIGQMSLVGPRPFPEYHLKCFRRDFRALRQSVLPGLTGAWQVGSRSNGDLDAQQSLDTYYIRNWSIWLDLHLLARTVSTVLLRRGAY